MADDMPDTLAMAKQLESAGIPPAQATAHAQVIANALLTERQYLATQLCTKSDFHVLQSDSHGLRSDFRGLQSEFRGLQSEFRGLQSDFRGLQSDFQVLRSDFQVLRSDVSAFQSKMLAEFARLEERTEKMIARCKLEIISWVVSLLLVQTAITSGLILKLLG